jgi:hypothetical protein
MTEFSGLVTCDKKKKKKMRQGGRVRVSTGRATWLASAVQHHATNLLQAMHTK